MIRTVRTWQVPEFKAADAMQLVKEAREHSRTHFPEQFATSQVFYQRFDVGTVTFYVVSDYEDLAAMERDLKEQAEPDETNKALWSRWADLIVAGEGEMVILESIETPSHQA